MLSIHELLEVAIKQKASDLVVKAGAAPAIRVDGRLQLTSLPVVTPEQTREIAYEIMFSASRDTLLQ
jgi:Tfp pilus assembly pilus retraction ATPase PilT